MNVLIVDDEAPALEELTDLVKKERPEARLFSCKNAGEAIEIAKSNTIEVALLDVRMRGITGIQLAKQLKEINSTTNIIFSTGYADYALEALNLYASGYMLKPITAEALNDALNNLRYPVCENESGVRVQCFGNFEVYNNGVPIRFSRSTSKEILAYLISKRGTSVTRSELAAIIWEEGLYSRSRQNQLNIFISDLKKDLEAGGCADVLINTRIGLMIDVSKINCDLYNFLAGDANAINAYSGEFMNAYSWAEFTLGYLDRVCLKKEDETE